MSWFISRFLSLSIFPTLFLCTPASHYLIYSIPIFEPRFSPCSLLLCLLCLLCLFGPVFLACVPAFAVYVLLFSWLVLCSGFIHSLFISLVDYARFVACLLFWITGFWITHLDLDQLVIRARLLLFNLPAYLLHLGPF